MDSKHLNLNYEISEKKTIVDSHVSTYSVILNGTVQGNGKGYSNQSLASAIYEAIEHYIYQNSSNSEMSVPISSICDGIIQNEYAVKVLKENLSPDDIIGATKFFDGNNKIFFPTALWNVYNNSIPDKCVSIKKYSTNSGCAIGTSLNDALIHALNELLERYSLSKHYYNVFIDHSEKAVFINPKSLSASLLELYNTISAEIGTEIIIVDIKTFDGFFCYQVFADNPGTGVPFKGSGLSTSSRYALERALLECLQSYHLQCAQNKIEDVTALSLFKELKKYNAILCLKYGADIQFADYVTSKEIAAEQIYQEEIKIIEQNKMNISYKILFSYNQIICVQVILHGNDKFYLVGIGIPVVPND